jgi:ABC-type molybdenum transport system ATPase subunit/photorepair protein PhrA
VSAATTADPVIRVRGLTKRYRDVQAVDGIDFDVAKGEIFGLLGPNGAGKTAVAAFAPLYVCAAVLVAWLVGCFFVASRTFRWQ